jgi:hypothetical protein
MSIGKAGPSPRGFACTKAGDGGAFSKRNVDFGIRVKQSTPMRSDALYRLLGIRYQLPD